MTDHALGWVPESCSLPTAQRRLRLAEFDELLTGSLRAQDRPSPTRLRWQFDPASESTARDLAARESDCCSIFTFTITPGDDELLVDVGVPTAHVDVLNALQVRAAAGIASPVDRGIEFNLG